MIFGEDPHERGKPRPQSEIVNETTELFDHFQFMSRRTGVPPVEIIHYRAFKSQLARILNKGVPKRTVKDSITAFFDTVDRTSKFPALWKIYLKNTTQDRLMSGLEAKPEVDSVVLAWMLNDFNRTEELPWPVEDDRRVRNIVLSHTDTLHRYPSFVAELLETRPIDEVRVILNGVQDLINEVLLASRRTRGIVSILRERGVPLPLGITARQTLRRCSPTLALAVFNDRHR
jgi:hypothetical protein